MLDWDDLRFFIAVARAGSTLGAARSLGVNQTTASRRVDALEAELGAALFERRPAGFRLTERGRIALGHAEKMEREASAFLSLTELWRREVSGSIRLTGTDTMATYILGPAIYNIRKSYPQLRIELIVDDRRLNLVAGEADVALRVGSKPHEPSLIARRMPDSCWAIYCSQAYAAAHGAPQGPQDLDNHLLIGGEGPLSRYPGMVWLKQTAPKADVVCRCNTLPNLYAMVIAGVGVSVLPCLVGASSEILVRCSPPPDQLRSPLWILYHGSLRRTSHIRVFVDALAREVEFRRAMLTGACEVAGHGNTRP